MPAGGFDDRKYQPPFLRVDPADMPYTVCERRRARNPPRLNAHAHNTNKTESLSLSQGPRDVFETALCPPSPPVIDFVPCKQSCVGGVFVFFLLRDQVQMFALTDWHEVVVCIVCNRVRYKLVKFAEVIEK